MKKQSIVLSTPNKKVSIVTYNLSEIKSMSPDKKIFVNRIKINSKMIEYQMSGKFDDSIEEILIKAKNEIREQELKQRKMTLGARMKISDILKVFNEPELSENNSFFVIKEY